MVIAGWTHAPGAPRDWNPAVHGDCGALPIRVQPYGTDAIMCESAWEPTPTELALLAAGGHVVLRVIGWQVPVALYVEPPPHDDADDVPS